MRCRRGTCPSSKLREARTLAHARQESAFLDAEGITAISRWLSAAIPPETTGGEDASRRDASKRRSWIGLIWFVGDRKDRPDHDRKKLEEIG